MNKGSPLFTPIRYVKGVGPKIAELLQTKGLLTAEDLLYYLPTRYLDRRTLVPLNALQEKTDVSVAGQILSCGLSFRRGRPPIFEAVLADETGAIRLRWFRYNRSYWQKTFQEGLQVIASGRVQRYRGEWHLIHPDIQVLGQGEAGERTTEAPGIIPLYPAIPRLGQKYLARLIANAWELCGAFIADSLPADFCEEHHLISLAQALQSLHFPDEAADIEVLQERRSPAHRRLIFEELFYLELGLAMKRQGVVAEPGLVMVLSQAEQEQQEAELPFRLTAAQRRVLTELYFDMARPHPMNRLLQGDVGSGKTVIALLAAKTALAAGYQVAVMAPTEILAEQHFRSFRTLLGPDASRVALLTASLKEKERKWLRLRLREGSLGIVIGTHALLSEAVAFKNLGLVVIDEQHRFGVMQRQVLRQKGKGALTPDVLVMTATPIPRTLAMTVYGELDVSVLDEMPPGRGAVTTRVVPARQRSEIYATMRTFLERHEQVFVIYPLVEETEKSDLKAATEMATSLREGPFANYTVGLLHGRMRGEEKDQVMRAFKEGSIHVLVATTVVEVGIDIPNATCMVIEHPERFGLSQLHQLRGRIGRGEQPSLCLLVASSKEQSEASRRRLQVMEKTQDGFKIAEADLEIRGPGEFLGTRQSGLPDLRFANLVRDVPILSEVRSVAFKLLAGDPRLQSYPLFKEVLYRRWQDKLALAEVG